MWRSELKRLCACRDKTHSSWLRQNKTKTLKLTEQFCLTFVFSLKKSDMQNLYSWTRWRCYRGFRPLSLPPQVIYMLIIRRSHKIRSNISEITGCEGVAWQSMLNLASLWSKPIKKHGLQGPSDIFFMFCYCTKCSWTHSNVIFLVFTFI